MGKFLFSYVMVLFGMDYVVIVICNLFDILVKFNIFEVFLGGYVSDVCLRCIGSFWCSVNYDVF